MPGIIGSALFMWFVNNRIYRKVLTWLWKFCTILFPGNVVLLHVVLSETGVTLTHADLHAVHTLEYNFSFIFAFLLARLLSLQPLLPVQHGVLWWVLTHLLQLVLIETHLHLQTLKQNIILWSVSMWEFTMMGQV